MEGYPDQAKDAEASLDDIDEEGEWDTQYCRRLQEELLSSSPRHSRDASPVGEREHEHEHEHEHEGGDGDGGNNNGNEHEGEDANAHVVDGDEVVAPAAAHPEGHEDETSMPQINPEPTPAKPSSHVEQSGSSTISNAPADEAGSSDPKALLTAKADHSRAQRGSHARLEALGANNNLAPPAQPKKTRARMEDGTQISSLTPTQENPESAYERFALQGPIESPPTEGMAHTQQGHGHDSWPAKHNSTVTDSTAHTYAEDDTGHVNFGDFVPGGSNAREDSPESEKEEPSQDASQDASYAPRLGDYSYQHVYEPETPAPPVNPFSQKGSVLKGHEMFGATQPSSIGRHVASATSSRPSPDVYNDFTSPTKRMPPSSPLVRHVEAAQTSPLQSSVRTLLRSKSVDNPHEMTSPWTVAQPVDSNVKIQPRRSTREPSAYISMKESQERRQREKAASAPDSETESDSDIDDASRRRHRRKQREEEIRRQLSTVELHRYPASSLPASSSPGIVEVPSTGRRRSIQDQYLAQCSGTDARDTQEEDVIMDSQTVPSRRLGQTDVSGASKDVPPSRDESVNTGSKVPASPNLPPRIHDAESAHPLDRESNLNGSQTSSPPIGPSSPVQQPSLPLQEVSTNRHDVKTPQASKNPVSTEDTDVIIPETSPSEAHIRPMGGITTMSFEEGNSDDLKGLPGFTQDTEFENAIQSPPSPDPTPRRRRSRYSAPFRDLSIPTAERAADAPTNSNEINSPPHSDKATTHDTTALQDAPVVSSNGAARSVVAEATETVDTPQLAADTIEAREAKEDTVAELGNHGDDAPKHAAQPPPNKKGLRSKEELNGPSRVLRRSTTTVAPNSFITPRQSSRVTKPRSTPKTRSSKNTATPSAASFSASTTTTAKSSVTRASAQKTTEETPVPASRTSLRRVSDITTVRDELAPSSAPAALTLKRKSTTAKEPPLRKRASKRQSVLNNHRDDSADPLASPTTPATITGQQKTGKLFESMAFAVSYLNHPREKDAVTLAITRQGGRILEDGFDVLFELPPTTKSRAQSVNDESLTLSPATHGISFVALIADEHSRKVKYMQALALGLPCISGKWISDCVSKSEIVDWTPYLLCAGQSSFLGNAIRSRTLQPYSATDASFPETFAAREKFLDGKSILVVTGKGRGSDKRKPYVFLTRVLEPLRMEQVPDLEQARKKLVDSEARQQTWDLLYVDGNEEHADKAVFGQFPTPSRKRKRGPTPADDTAATPAPKRIKVITDEVVVQSLILGRWMD